MVIATKIKYAILIMTCMQCKNPVYIHSIIGTAAQVITGHVLQTVGCIPRMCTIHCTYIYSQQMLKVHMMG